MPTSKMLCNSFQGVKNIINTTVYTVLVCLMHKHTNICWKLLRYMSVHCNITKVVCVKGDMMIALL